MVYGTQCSSLDTGIKPCPRPCTNRVNRFELNLNFWMIFSSIEIRSNWNSCLISPGFIKTIIQPYNPTLKNSNNIFSAARVQWRMTLFKSYVIRKFQVAKAKWKSSNHNLENKGKIRILKLFEGSVCQWHFHDNFQRMVKIKHQMEELIDALENIIGALGMVNSEAQDLILKWCWWLHYDERF